MLERLLTRMNFKFIKCTLIQSSRLRRKLLLNSNLSNYEVFRYLNTTSFKRSINSSPSQDYKKVTIIHDKSRQLINISLRYFDESLRINKYFMFNRKPEEKCAYTLQRMADKINEYAGNKATQKGIANLETVKIYLESKTGDQVSEDLSCIDTFTSTNNYLRIGNILYSLNVNPPKLTTLQLPKCIMAGYTLYPSKIEGINCNLSETQLTWFRSMKKYLSAENANASKGSASWERIGENFMVSLSSDDVSRLLRVNAVPCIGDHEGAESRCISSVLVSEGQLSCPFEKRHQNTKEVLNKGYLRIVSYNILANCYANSDFSRTTLYPTIPHYALEFDYRKLLLHKEILGYNADLICLQEVDSSAFEDDFQPVFSRCGFKGIFHKKDTKNLEGLSLFYRKAKLKLRKEYCYILAEELQNNELFCELLKKVKLNESFCNAFLMQKTILQVCVFSTEESPSDFLVVGSTHLVAKPDANHLRLLQAWLCIALLQNIVESWKSGDHNNDVSLILCGDFNSLPDSGVYRLVTSGGITEDEVDWKSKSKEEVEGISLSHHLQLGSACGIPEFTTYTVGFKAAIDYIFYEEDKFSVSQVVPFPSREELAENGALPSVTFPSDHIALVADLKWHRKSA